MVIILVPEGRTFEGTPCYIVSPMADRKDTIYENPEVFAKFPYEIDFFFGGINTAAP